MHVTIQIFGGCVPEPTCWGGATTHPRTQPPRHSCGTGVAHLPRLARSLNGSPMFVCRYATGYVAAKHTIKNKHIGLHQEKCKL